VNSLDAPRSARLRRWLSVLAVLVFGFKGLIPSGYMFAAVDGHAQLIICPAGLHDASATRSTAGVHFMAGMAHMPGMVHSAHAALAANQCPFALAGGAALRAAVVEPAAPSFVTLQPARAVAAVSVPITPPSRFHAPRGPPSLA
jgi:hypothetical protein